MVFKSKAQIAAEQETASAVIPVRDNVISDSTEKNEKNKSGVESEIKLKRELYEKDKELEELRKELERSKVKPGIQSDAPGMELIHQLQGQISQLNQQVMGAAQGKKLLFRKPTVDDLLPMEEAITFTARSVIYIVASYTDHQGLEQLPPFKLIVFNYAASDIRKEGREEEIKNFSQYTTNLKPEIEFLRNHPYYGVTFSENTNEMMGMDTKEMEFKERAATQLANAVPESIFEKARELNISNWQKKSPNELKHLIVNEMSRIYKKEAQELQDNILRRQTLGNLVLNNKE
jgi:hypothetical protein